MLVCQPRRTGDGHVTPPHDSTPRAGRNRTGSDWPAPPNVAVARSGRGDKDTASRALSLIARAAVLRRYQLAPTQAFVAGEAGCERFDLHKGCWHVTLESQRHRKPTRTVRLLIRPLIVRG
jgi:hypothetical protein